ncbi:MAG: PIG-L family deacetylase [Anaerolineales bacterium]
MEKLKLLAVFAHPDDESMGMGGTLAKYAAQGVETHLLCATRGERGWFGDPNLNPGFEGLARIRSLELKNAARELGMTSIHFLDYIDGDVDQADYGEAILKIVEHIRAIRPQVMVTFPPDGNYGHPDHVAIGQFACAAAVCAAAASYSIESQLPPHCVSKLYYMVDGEDFIHLIAPFMGDMTFPVGDQMRGEVAWKNWTITTRIEMSAYCGAAWRAILRHQSQLATLGALAEMPAQAAESVLAMQGTFYRAYSLVNGGREIEDDFFEGLR